ncbi:MAG: arsenic efflux protein [Bacilli bacterium]|nr:arsenic efflux protein [Bacilli bacterium]
MKDCLMDGLLDTVKLLPYLLITFLLLEFIEHKLSKKNQKVLSNNKKYGPFVGGIFGALPQCGFSSMAANLFSARVITMGTLIAVFLSTSDEMLPIMLSEKCSPILLFKIIGFKVLIGITIGFIIDLIYRKNNSSKNEEIKELCEHDHCGCEHDGIILSSIKHTLKIGFFILVVNLIINLIIFKVGENNLSNLLHHKNILSYFIACLIGLIPNCAGSVIITEVYLAKFITVGTMIGGLLTGSGLGILLLFKTNKNLKENLSILSIIYFTGVIIGFLIDLFI